MRLRHRLRRRRGVSRRPGMKGDWITLMKTECPFTGVAVFPCDQAPTTMTPDAVTLIDDADLTDKEDKLTLVRMVGAVNPVLFLTFEVTAPLSSPVGGIVSCHEGIYKAGIGSDGSVADLNPFVAADYDRDTWLWLRETSFGVVVGGATDGFDNFVLSGGAGTMTPPSAAQFDVHVKRKLERGECLIYSWCWSLQLTLVPPAQGGTLPTSVNLITASKLTAALRGYVKF